MNLIYQIDLWIDLKKARKAFLILALLPIAFIFIDGLFLSSTKPKQSFLPVTHPPTTKNSKESLAAYRSAFEKSSLFGNISNSTLAVTQVSVLELIKDYRLKGVVIMDEPEAMLEDARTQKMNYLRKGSRLGDLTVKEIKEGCMVLTYGTQEVKLEIQ